MNEAWKRAKWEKPDIKGHILYDSTWDVHKRPKEYTKNRCAWGKWGVTTKVSFFFRRWKCSNVDCGGSCTAQNILKTNDLYTLQEWPIGVCIISQKGRYLKKKKKSLRTTALQLKTKLRREASQATWAGHPVHVVTHKRQSVTGEGRKLHLTPRTINSMGQTPRLCYCLNWHKAKATRLQKNLNEQLMMHSLLRAFSHLPMSSVYLHH